MSLQYYFNATKYILNMASSAILFSSFQLLVHFSLYKIFLIILLAFNEKGEILDLISKLKQEHLHGRSSCISDIFTFHKHKIK